MNSINILATITREPKLKYALSGVAILSFGIAYNEKRKQQDGSYGDVAHFFEVTAFGKKAETVNQWFRKGSRILLQGSLDYQSWEQEGQKRSKVGIKLNDFDFIDKRESNSEANQAPTQGGRSGNPQQYQNTDQANHTAYRQPQKQMTDKNTLLQDYIDESSIPF